MSNVHMVVGTLVIIGFAVSLILNVMSFARGTFFPWQRAVSFGAATLLLLQYMLGFSLLGEGKDIPATHFLIALATVVPVGLEHMYAGTRTDTRQRGLMGAVMNTVALVLVLVAYMIGETNT
jgi:hypothetical protein